MKKAYFIDYSGSVSPRILPAMSAIGLAMRTAGHEVYFLDAAGPLVATFGDLKRGAWRPDLLRGGGTPPSLEPFYLAGPATGGRPWEYARVPHSWDGYEVSLLTDGYAPETLLVCFDNVLVFSSPKEDLVRDVMTA